LIINFETRAFKPKRIKARNEKNTHFKFDGDSEDFPLSILMTAAKKIIMITVIELIGNLWLFFGIVFFFLGIIGFKSKKIEKTNKTPSISVIIAAWNEGSRIRKCINSILRQNYKNKIEIIVVGGGEDNTTEVCKKLSKERKIKFIREKKRMGKWFSLNKGVKNAKLFAEEAGFILFVQIPNISRDKGKIFI